MQQLQRVSHLCCVLPSQDFTAALRHYSKADLELLRTQGVIKRAEPRHVGYGDIRTPVPQFGSLNSDDSLLGTPNCCISIIFPPYNNSITCLLHMENSGLIHLRQRNRPRLFWRFLTDIPSSTEGRCKHTNSIINDEIALRMSGRTQKTLHPGNWRFNQSTVKGNSFRINTKIGQDLNWVSEIQGDQLEHLQQIKMFTGYKEVHLKK